MASISHQMSRPPFCGSIYGFPIRHTGVAQILEGEDSNPPNFGARITGRFFPRNVLSSVHPLNQRSLVISLNCLFIFYVQLFHTPEFDEFYE